jgi:NDP-sugar pyrophosphorylase family protein
MDVVILCGGQGARMREETEYRPKPMVEVGSRPLLWHIMRLFGHHGLSRFVLCLGYKGSMIKEVPDKGKLFVDKLRGMGFEKPAIESVAGDRVCIPLTK